MYRFRYNKKLYTTMIDKKRKKITKKCLYKKKRYVRI